MRRDGAGNTSFMAHSQTMTVSTVWIYIIHFSTHTFLHYPCQHSHFSTLSMSALTLFYIIHVSTHTSLHYPRQHSHFFTLSMSALTLFYIIHVSTHTFLHYPCQHSPFSTWPMLESLFSRPGLSQGLLYKHLRHSLIKSVILFLSQLYIAATPKWLEIAL